MILMGAFSASPRPLGEIFDHAVIDSCGDTRTNTRRRARGRGSDRCMACRFAHRPIPPSRWGLVGGTRRDLSVTREAAMIDMGLERKHVLVAGAGRGIGAACARIFAAVGARVACLDVDRGRCDAVVEE